MRLIKNFLFIICILFASLLFLTGIVMVITQKNIPAFIFFCAIGTGIILLGRLVHKKTKREQKIILIKEQEKIDRINHKMEKDKLIPGSSARINELHSNICIQGIHVSGLPIAQDAQTYLYLCEDKIIFERNDTIYNLYWDKIKDVTIKTDAEIQKSYVSSVGGAVAGGVLFGPLGAIIGGRAKTKIDKRISNYLIFTYSKEETIDFISFEVTGISKAKEFVKFFEKNKSTKKIEINL
jgi:hypothetical protein